MGFYSFVLWWCTNIVCIGNSMVSSAIWKKTCTSEFFKEDQNCTSPKDKCNLKSLKNSRVHVFLKLHEKPYYYLLIIYKKKFSVNYIFIWSQSSAIGMRNFKPHIKNHHYSSIVIAKTKVRETYAWYKYTWSEENLRI